MECVGTYNDCRGVLGVVKKTNPDVILMDMRMPEMNGLSVLKQIKQAKPDLPVAMLTTSSDEADLVGALQLGANGYLMKDLQKHLFIVR